MWERAGQTKTIWQVIVCGTPSSTNLTTIIIYRTNTQFRNNMGPFYHFSVNNLIFLICSFSFPIQSHLRQSKYFQRMSRQFVYYNGSLPIKIIINFQQQITKMSATKFIAPLRVEADQKEIIIAHLKEELYHLKRNQQEFYNLEDQYRKLQHKYRMLAEEKAIGDSDFKNRHQAALRTLCALRAELDDMKAELRDKSLEISDLQTDENTLRNQLDQRNIQIEKLKAELNSLLADADQLAIARRNLLQTADRTRQGNANLADKIHGLDIENEGVLRKVGDTQKYLDQLLTQQKIIKQKIIAYQNQNNNLDNDINATSDDLAILQGRILDAQNQIKNLQSAIAETDALANKFKSEAIHYQKATQAEVMKNNDTTKLLAQAENTLRLRIHQVEQGRNQIAALQQQNQNLSRNNRGAQDDLEFCRKHLQNLALINSQIVRHLEVFCEEDEQVRRLIDRRGVVVRMRGRVEETSSLLNRTTVVTHSLPTLVSRSPLKGYR